MKITKLGHACLVLEKEGKVLVIDPGSLTELPSDIRADVVVITEEHFDHCHPDNVKKLIATNPSLRILCNKSVGDLLIEQDIAAEILERDSVLEALGFMLEFTHKDHAPVYRNSPCRVMTVRVDDVLYYAADSYETSETPVDILAVPTSGPWFKISEAIDYVKESKCKRIMFTHNGLNSAEGNIAANKYIASPAEAMGIDVIDLQAKESIEC